MHSGCDHQEELIQKEAEAADPSELRPTITTMDIGLIPLSLF